MPTFRPNGRPANRRWQARVQNEKHRVSLGFFETRDEAVAEENRYREANGLRSWTQRTRHDLRARHPEAERRVQPEADQPGQE